GLEEGERVAGERNRREAEATVAHPSGRATFGACTSQGCDVAGSAIGELDDVIDCVAIAIEILGGDRLLENQRVELGGLAQSVQRNRIERDRARNGRNYRADAGHETGREV